MRHNPSWVAPNLSKTWLVKNSTGYIVTYDTEKTSPGNFQGDITQGSPPKRGKLKTQPVELDLVENTDHTGGFFPGIC